MRVRSNISEVIRNGRGVFATIFHCIVSAGEDDEMGTTRDEDDTIYIGLVDTHGLLHPLIPPQAQADKRCVLRFCSRR